MRRTVRLAGAVLGTDMIGVMVFAQAFATLPPGGSDPTGNFRDANGQWAGFVQAWDFGPSGPMLLGAWTLD